jgi:hypothetical protein
MPWLRVTLWLEIVIFGGLLFVFMYFLAAKVLIARKIREWHLKAREEGGKSYGETGRNNQKT